MKVVALLTTLVALTNADKFKWKPNNNFGNDANWQGGAVPTGNADLGAGCLDKFGEEGGLVSISKSVEVSSLELMEVGELDLQNGAELTITGDEGKTDGAWRCKTPLEKSSACSSNYLMEDKDGKWVAADTAPCYADTIQFDGLAATSVLWAPNQFLYSVEVTGQPGGTKTYGTSAALEKFDATMNTQFQGAPPVINEPAKCGGNVLCKALCFDVCPTTTLELGSQNREEFFKLPPAVQDQVIENTYKEQDNLNNIRYDVNQAFQSGKAALKQTSQLYQGSYDTKMQSMGSTVVNTNQPVTIPEVKATAAAMANWLEIGGVGSVHEEHYIRNSINKENAGQCVTFFGEVADGKRFYGTDGSPDYLPMKLNDELWTNIDKKGFVRGGRLRRATYADVAAFILHDANKILKSFTNNANVEIVSFSDWKAVAADPSLDFAIAAGAFSFTNVQVLDTQAYEDATTSELQTFIDPQLISMALSVSVVRMTLFVQAENLRLEIHFRPTTTLPPTISPTLSPTSSPTAEPTLSPTIAPTAVSADFLESNMIPLAAGGGGLILIIIIIIIVIFVVGGSSKSKSKSGDDNRQVVAFENPMYDNPTQVEEDAQSVESGNYDDPVMDEKANPMYQSNEELPNNEGGGYLDVETDEADEDDDDENEDDDVEDDEEDDEDDE